jgi:hypothetical protein
LNVLQRVGHRLAQPIRAGIGTAVALKKTGGSHDTFDDDE